MDKKKQMIFCTCDCSAIEISRDKDFIYLSTWFNGYCNHRGFFGRLRDAWKFLRRGRAITHDICLKLTEAERMQEILNQIIAEHKQ